MFPWPKIQNIKYSCWPLVFLYTKVHSIFILYETKLVSLIGDKHASLRSKCRKCLYFLSSDRLYFLARNVSWIHLKMFLWTKAVSSWFNRNVEAKEFHMGTPFAKWRIFCPLKKNWNWNLFRFRNLLRYFELSFFRESSCQVSDVVQVFEL